jgi:hypothetical protein
MKIRITEDKKVEIEAALKEVNGQAYKHAYTEFCEINNMAREAESTLGTLINRSDMRGARWTETSGAKVANAYNNARIGTRVTIERGVDAWFLVDVQPATLTVNGGGKGRMYLTPAQDQAARDRFAKRYIVAAQETTT